MIVEKKGHSFVSLILILKLTGIFIYAKKGLVNVFANKNFDIFKRYFIYVLSNKLIWNRSK